MTGEECSMLTEDRRRTVEGVNRRRRGSEIVRSVRYVNLCGDRIFFHGWSKIRRILAQDFWGTAGTRPIYRIFGSQSSGRNGVILLRTVGIVSAQGIWTCE